MMPNQVGKDALLSRLRPDDKAVWSIINELNAKSEEELRRILRPRADGESDRGVHAFEDGQRARLDAALGALTILEIAGEVGVVPDPAPLVPEVAGVRKLFESEAVLHYADAYLYFGARFLAGRVAAPAWLKSKGECALPPRSSDAINTRSFALTVPPSLPADPESGAAFVSFLSLSNSPEAEKALKFLDDVVVDVKEPGRFELWLRGLQPDAGKEEQDRFKHLREGLTDWAGAHCNFYSSLKSAAKEKNWINNPAVARFGLRDIYWIARLLRAEVSATAVVSYPRPSWLELLRFRAGLDGVADCERLRNIEDVLRSVFDFVCDLVQNAVALSDEAEKRAFEPELFTTPTGDTVKWPEMFDEEMIEIAKERKERDYHDSSEPQDGRQHPGSSQRSGGDPPGAPPPSRGDGWFERIKTGERPTHLIGLAFSGGGIRSATFNLGVLQGLQEFDLLRCVDYLSTVSGGGFIGSWLVASVRRTRHWLGRRTPWDDSVAYLRSYSNYLAPRTGVLSADTWSMWASWARNAFLIQITGLVWAFALLLTALIAQSGFDQVAALPVLRWFPVAYAGVLVGLLMALILFSLLYNLTGGRAVSGRDRAFGGKLVRRLAVCPAVLGAFLTAALLWADATGRSAFSCYLSGVHLYSEILVAAWRPWLALLGTMCAALSVVAWVTLSRNRWYALWIGVVTVAALYLQLCGIMWLFVSWAAKDPHRYGWYAFVVGPPLVLAVNSISVVLFIGFCGRNSNESIREWWTRYGTWLGIYGGGYLFVAAAAVFGPWGMLSLRDHTRWNWAPILSWIGTVVGGLLAGNSSKTSGNDPRTKSPALEILAKAGGLLFIIGAVLGAATLLYVLLLNIGTNYAISDGYWKVFPEIPVWLLWASLGVALILGGAFSWFFEINIFGLNQFYRMRLVRCYLGATRWTPGIRKPQPFTNFDGWDDMKLRSIVDNDRHDPDNRSGDPYRGPFPILNCSLNLGGSPDLALNTRHSASFSLTPLRCGSDRPKVGYARTQRETGLMLGQAVSISGAAVSPNMGYNTSPLVAFLLTMFDVRLGWWFPNPGQESWDSPGLRFSLYYLVQELFGLANETKRFVNISDGGHFENLGIYELVRRRCKVIIASDAECDESLQFPSLGNVIRICETDFGAKIDVDVSSIRQQKDGFSQGHCAIGKITYSNGSIGYLIYLKASITGDEDVAITQYRAVHPSFPHETTADQFFSEDQFESYRQLGLHIVRHSLRGNQPGDDPLAIAKKLADVLAPAGSTSEVFLKHTKALNAIWERFRQSSAAELLHGRAERVRDSGGWGPVALRRNMFGAGADPADGRRVPGSPPGRLLAASGQSRLGDSVYALGSEPSFPCSLEPKPSYFRHSV